MASVGAASECAKHSHRFRDPEPDQVQLDERGCQVIRECGWGGRYGRSGCCGWVGPSQGQGLGPGE